MSGGAFEYNQYRIGQIADEIDHIIRNNGKKRPKERDYDYCGENYPEHSKAVLGQFKKAVKALRIAQVYAHEIDWYVSGDTGEESFLECLEEGLGRIKKDK